MADLEASVREMLAPLAGADEDLLEFLVGSAVGALEDDEELEDALLPLLESGLPAWSIFLPAYGIYYRPWFRKATRLAWVLISVVSMIVGFYDLYKNVPGARARVGAKRGCCPPPPSFSLAPFPFRSGSLLAAAWLSCWCHHRHSDP